MLGCVRVCVHACVCVCVWMGRWVGGGVVVTEGISTLIVSD